MTAKTEVKKDTKANNGVKDKATDPKEAKEALKMQLREHKKQADHHTTMYIKAQGALEVLLQLYPEENSES